MEAQVKISQPRGLWILSFTAIWERFSYYGMRAFLIFYMANDILNPNNKNAHLGGLGFTEEYAGLIYGVFVFACYLLPLLGGFLADNYIGKRKSVIIGSLLIMIGHFTLAADINVTSFFTGLFILALGNGFFKPNCSSMIGDLYQPGDKRRDSGFTIFYMLFNGGAAAAPILCGYFAETYRYNYGFLIAGFAMLFGLIIYLIAAEKYLGDIGKKPINKKVKNATTEKQKLTKIEKDRILVIVILMLFVTFFWAGFEQAGTTLNLYTNKFIDRSFFSWVIPTTWFQAVNPIFILILGSIFAALWVALAKIKKNPSTPAKMGFGMIALSIGYLFIIGAISQRAGDNDANPMIKASMLWICGVYLFHTIGELCLSPIGLSMVTKLAPARYASLFMGLWFASSAVANLLAGLVVSLLALYGALHFFTGIICIVAVLGIIILFMSKWLLKMMHGVD
jgi:proton-dependent oligopeptide transporter, POT family